MTNKYDDFDWEFYVYFYDDLQINNINTNKSALDHWINYGQYENRIYFLKNNKFDNFDWRKYISYYEDLKNKLFTYKDAINHWVKYGNSEKRYFFKKK